MNIANYSLVMVAAAYLSPVCSLEQALLEDAWIGEADDLWLGVGLINHKEWHLIDKRESRKSVGEGFRRGRVILGHLDLTLFWCDQASRKMSGRK